jgi:hypothetical protein
MNEGHFKKFNAKTLHILSYTYILNGLQHSAALN